MGAALPITGPAVPGFEDYDRIIPALLEEGQLPGAAVAVAYRGRIVFARGYGVADRETGRPMQPDTRLRIASTSKVFTAALVLKLVEDGRLALDTPVFPALGYATPTYAGASRDPRLDRITIRQLLDHTVGWDRDTARHPLRPNQAGFDACVWQADVAQMMGGASPPSAETIVRFMVGQPLQWEPGTSWHYSNVGYLTLGRLIERATGLPYETALQRFVAGSYVSGLATGGSQRHELGSDEAAYYDGSATQPLYLGDGNPRVPSPYAMSYPAYDASGALCISAVELLRFLLALEGQNGTPLLRPESLAAMRTGTPVAPWYGFGWFTTNALQAFPATEDSGHGGTNWGVKSYAMRTPDGDWLVAALVNGSVADNVRMNNGAAAALHRLPDYAVAPPRHDFTWSTLGWDAWRKRFFGEAPTGPHDDAERDGLPNLVEYSAGLDPTGEDAEPPATLRARGDGALVFTHRRLILGHPLTWTIESSRDGVSWSAVAPSEAQTALNADGTVSSSLLLPDTLRARLRVRQVASGAESVFEPELSPETVVASIGDSVTFSAGATGSSQPWHWRKNGATLVGATGAAVALANLQPGDAGIYTAELDGIPGSMRIAAIVAIRSNMKVAGAGEVVGSDIRHQNGNVYDQVLLTGGAATITADPGQVTRISFLDLTDDIVQVEFSGAGSLTVALGNASGPALPLHYNQQTRYMKGHATLVVADADATTHVSAFSVGKANAVNAALFRPEVDYDGFADLAALGIQSVSGKVGGIYFGNAHLFAAAGVTGIHARGVEVTGTVRLGDLCAYDIAAPALVLGGAAHVAVTGGALRQANGAPVEVHGVARVEFAAGGKSDGGALPAQPNGAVFTSYGVDVTEALVGR